MSSFVLCVGCGEPLYGFSPCQWCTCKRCGIDLRDGICPLCNSRNSCVHDSNPNSFDCPPDSYHPPHPTYETYSVDSCGNDPQFGYDYPPQFPLNYEPEPGYSQNYNSYPHDSSSFLQQYPCCDDCGLNSTLAKIKDQMKSITSLCDMACQVVQKKLEEKQLEEERAAKAKYWKLPVFYDDDDDEERSDSLDANIISGLPPFSAITPDEPVLSTEEPDNSLSMGDEHLDTIPACESDEFIKSGVETLIPIP
nr:pre-mRNA splicing Prp18-interacting factor [Tanacetum cinerariifolium]